MADQNQSDWSEVPDPRRTPWLAGIIGGLIGLCIGLALAWLVWPAEWSPALPQDLGPEIQAEYISSVADAYIVERSSPAEELAQQRLRHFGDRASQAVAIEGARSWYLLAKPADYGLRVQNIDLMANTLGLVGTGVNIEARIADGQIVVDVDTSADNVSDGAADTIVIVPPVVDVTPVFVSSEPISGTSNLGWLRWLLVVLTALTLISGGLFVLRRLFYERDRQPEEEFSAVRGPEGAVNTQADVDQNYTNVDSEIDDFTRQQDSVYGETREDQAVDDDYGFNDEPEEISSAGAISVKVSDRGAASSDRMSSTYSGDEAAPIQSPSPDGFSEEEGSNLRPTGATREIKSAAPVPMAPTQDRAPAPTPRSTTAPNVSYGQDAASRSQDASRQASTASAAPQSTATSATTESASVPPPPAAAASSESAAASSPSSPELGQKLGTFSAHYQYGIPDYDQSFSFRDSSQRDYIGDCGMGVNMKNGILQNNPENVIALDVWLFDKVDERNIKTTTTVLISNSIQDDQWKNVFDSDTTGGPVLAEPGTRFQIEGNQLALDCIVKAVSISDHPDSLGSFREVIVDMSVRRRR